MGGYILRRILIAIPVFISITVGAYILLALTPGDPVLSRIDPEILARLTPADLERRRHDLGLDGPLVVQYARWAMAALQGDLGFSLSTHRSILAEVAPRVGPTLWLMGTAAVIGVLLGIPLGVVAAVRQYSRLDYTLTALTMFMISTPSFVLGLLFIYLLGVDLHVLPVGGMFTLGKPFDLGDRIAHVIMPASVLGLAYAAPLMRYTRASMLEALHSEHVVTARAKGLRSLTVLTRHGLRNALLPVITLLGLLLPELMGGAVITEQVFAWPGMGQLAVTAAGAHDTPLVMGVLMPVAIVVLVSSILADVGYAIADPRVRLGGEQSRSRG